MMEDQQTHLVPKDSDQRARLARLCGQEDLGAFDSALHATRETVSRHYRDLFAEEERKAELAQGAEAATGDAPMARMEGEAHGTDADAGDYLQTGEETGEGEAGTEGETQE